MNYHYEIIQDNHPESPREWDNLGTMVCWHKKLGDVQPKETPYQWMLDKIDSFKIKRINGIPFETLWQIAGDVMDKPLVEAITKEFERDNIFLPLYIYDHSGITINTRGFSCPWDSSQVGFIYVSKDQVKKEYKWVRLSRKRIKKIRDYLDNEVKTYDDFLVGNVYGYVITDDDGEHIDSCWGFYGYGTAEREAKSIISLKERK